ncbi:hypothetical protein J2Z49_001412 [Desulfofundulus luciae]|uniref:Uncharacterized protein n=1 Tax=Desulfofundulus luciae TaxID=74702 RepID=A0ABU0B4B7_9FIRM|nr:hypothetical protein [Desulfofundulus luciae]MDQ0286298.1 hypothetical protein [Desulfofundulus luciae]
MSTRKEVSRRPGGAGLPAVSLLEGATIAVPAVLTGQTLYHPLLFLLLGFYTSWRVGRVRQACFLGGFCLGAVVAAAAIFGVSGKVLFAKALAVIMLVVAVFAAYRLFSGAHFFATYYHSPRAWVTTLWWALVTGLFVRGAGVGDVGVMITPMIWLCLLPLWASSWRLLHSLLFAVTFLTAVYLPVLLGGDIHLVAGQWPVGVAALGLALVPELLGYLYPGRKHPLDSLPVITPTLNWWQKLKAWREVFFLLGDFYALNMEKYAWFVRSAHYGRYFIFLGAAGEIVAPLLDLLPWLAWLAGLLALAGMLMELGAGNYGVMIPGLGFYGAAMAAGRGFLAGPVQYFPLVCGTLLVLLSFVLWQGRPRETPQELQRWKELNSPATLPCDGQ